MNEIIWKVKWCNHIFEIHKSDWGYHFYEDGEWCVDEKKGKFKDDDEAIETWRKICCVPKDWKNLVIR
jgi:hypothetical protein